MQKHIVIITGSRAEWGLLRPVHNELILLGIRTTVLITGSHLHSQSDHSEKEIVAEAGGEIIRVYITPEDLTLNPGQLMLNSMANALNRIPDALRKLNPDMAIILGDRYEIFAAATACRLSGIRLAHISGGELTLGAFDDALRHCITKLSDLHFTAAEEYRRRVIQLGEEPQRVFNVGELALDKLSQLPLKSQEELEHLLGCKLDSFFLLTIHPETCSPGEGIRITTLLLELLPVHFPGFKLVFTGANADPEGEKINLLLKQFSINSGAGCYFASLGRLNYLSLAKLARCVIGNSSSGIAEVPALGTPVVNIGRRQLGRTHGLAVTSVASDHDQILQAIKKAADLRFREVAMSFPNPYQGEDSARQIASIIASLDLTTISREKKFHDL